jgi:hypothetical protein
MAVPSKIIWRAASGSCSRVHINPLHAELNPICHLLALLGAHHILHVSRVRVKKLTLALFIIKSPASNGTLTFATVSQGFYPESRYVQQIPLISIPFSLESKTHFSKNYKISKTRCVLYVTVSNFRFRKTILYVTLYGKVNRENLNVSNTLSW